MLQTQEKILDGARIPAGFGVGKVCSAGQEFEGSQFRKVKNKDLKPLIFCEAPGCCKPYDEKHHTKRLAQHHIHDPDQIYLVCKEHHNLMHHGLIAHEELGPQFWRVHEHADYETANLETNTEAAPSLYQKTGDPALMTSREFIDQRVQHYKQEQCPTNKEEIAVHQ